MRRTASRMGKSQAQPIMVQPTHFADGGTEDLLMDSATGSTTGGCVDAYYRSIERAVEKVRLGYSHLCFVKGRPGIGKSFQIERCLRKSRLEYVEINGDTSEAYLYRILYQHNGKVVWFKDVARLLRGLRSIDLLKNACETTPERLITNMNYSDKQLDLPRRFYFTGSIIFDFNSLSGLRFREDLEALASRGDYIELVLSHGEICDIMRCLCRTPAEREVTEFLVQHYQYCGHNALNLRTQCRAFQTLAYARAKGLDWRNELKEELRYQRSRVHKVLYPILGDGSRPCADVKRYLVKAGVVSTMRTADRRINDWLDLGEIHRVSAGHRNFHVSLVPIRQALWELGPETSDTGDTCRLGKRKCHLP